jgi:Ser/Thr protein kinase RdoA (MazF antagonist)
LGKPLSRSNRFGEQRLDFAYKYGTSIAKLHHALLSVEGDIMPNEINLYKTVVDWALPEVKKQNEQWKLELSEDFFTDYIVTFGSLFPKLPQQLIHRNPCPPFILFKDNEVNGFYGYDLSERNLRLFDPCYCATGILAEHEGVEDAFEKWIPILKEIIHGYDKVNPLTSEEKESIYYVVCSIQMIFIPWCEPQSQLKDLGKLNRKMLQLIIANKEIIKGQIKSL